MLKNAEKDMKFSNDNKETQNTLNEKKNTKMRKKNCHKKREEVEEIHRLPKLCP